MLKAMRNSYAQAGVDTGEADAGVDAIVSVLKTVQTGSPSRSVIASGHYASVIEIAPNLGVALCTDGVGSKLVVAEQTGRYDTVGIDCVAMNVNDLVCIGAKPLALLDYIAVEQADPQVLGQVAQGLKRGAELAGVEIPGGELAQLPELIRGHPSPNGLDLVGSCFGTVALDRVIDGNRCSPGDVLIGVPSSGIHSNGLTLARKVLLENFSLDDRPAELEGDSVADVLLEPTEIYVKAVLELLEAGPSVHGMAHITGGGLTNLLRLNPEIGFEIDQPLPAQPVFQLIGALGDIPHSELYEVFNMGCGLCVVVPTDSVEETLSILKRHHPGTEVIGSITARAGVVAAPSLAIEGTKAGLQHCSI